MADATDYLLHAALGVLSGGQKAYQRHLDIQETDELARRKLKMEEESKKRLLEFEQPLKIEQRQAVPSGYYYDETLNQLLPVPAGGKMEGKFNVPPLKTATSEEKEEAKRAISEARETIAKSIGAKEEEIFFTSGGTESNNWALKGLFFTHPDKNHIIVTKIEHDCILETCRWLESRGAKITYLDVNKEGFVNPKDIENVATNNISYRHINISF